MEIYNGYTVWVKQEWARGGGKLLDVIRPYFKVGDLIGVGFRLPTLPELPKVVILPFIKRWLFSTNHKDIGTLYLIRFDNCFLVEGKRVRWGLIIERMIKKIDLKWAEDVSGGRMGFKGVWPQWKYGLGGLYNLVEWSDSKIYENVYEGCFEEYIYADSSVGEDDGFMGWGKQEKLVEGLELITEGYSKYYFFWVPEVVGASGSQAVDGSVWPRWDRGVQVGWGGYIRRLEHKWFRVWQPDFWAVLRGGGERVSFTNRQRWASEFKRCGRAGGGFCRRRFTYRFEFLQWFSCVSSKPYFRVRDLFFNKLNNRKYRFWGRGVFLPSRANRAWQFVRNQYRGRCPVVVVGFKRNSFNGFGSFNLNNRGQHWGGGVGGGGDTRIGHLFGWLVYGQLPVRGGFETKDFCLEYDHDEVLFWCYKSVNDECDWEEEVDPDVEALGGVRIPDGIEGRVKAKQERGFGVSKHQVVSLVEGRLFLSQRFQKQEGDQKNFKQSWSYAHWLGGFERVEKMLGLEMCYFGQNADYRNDFHWRWLEEDEEVEQG